MSLELPLNLNSTANMLFRIGIPTIFLNQPALDDICKLGFE